MSEILALVKFGVRDNLIRIREFGELYLNTWEYFKNLDKNVVQGDKNEGLVTMLQVDQGVSLSVHDGENWLPIGGLYGQIRFSAAGLNQYNLFCLYAVTAKSYEFLRDIRLLEFGDSALLFLQGDEFISCLDKKLDDEGLKYKRGLVRYVDRNSYQGEMGPFVKLETYAYQSEYRYFVNYKRGSAVKLTIGELSDICHIIKTEELADRLKLVKTKS